MSKCQRNLIAPDIHSDYDGLGLTLKEMGLAQIDNGKVVLQKGEYEELVFTGDYVDRGPEFYKVLDLLIEIRDRLHNTTFEVGNHDVLMLLMLLEQRKPRWTCEWMGSGGDKVLLEVAKHFKCRLTRAVQDSGLLENPIVANDGDKANLSLFKERWGKITQQNPELKEYDLPVAANLLRDQIFGGEYNDLFAKMKLVHPVGKRIITVHAGLNPKAVELGWDKVNDNYRLAWERQNFRPLYAYDWDKNWPEDGAPLSGLINMTRPIPPKRQPGPLIEQQTAEDLRKKGIYAMIHGHAVLVSGVQECHNDFGVADINGDACISRGHGANKSGRSRPAFIEHDTTTGKLTAFNEITGKMELGTVRDDGFDFVKKN